MFDFLLKYEWLTDWVLCFVIPSIFFQWDFHNGIAYATCMLLFTLIRIGNLIRDKQ